MPTGSVRPSVAVGRLLRERRTALRMSLAEAARRLAALGSPIPHSTLVRIEQGKLDPGVRRLHYLLRLYEIPPTLVADVVELEEMASTERLAGTPEQLYQRGIAAWRDGDIATGLAYFFALRQEVGSEDADRVFRLRATLGFAIAARDLGKFRLAKTLVDELLLDDPPAELITKGLTVAASIWSGLGSLPVAFAMTRHAAATLRPDDHEMGAHVAHQEAQILERAGRFDESAQALDRAVSHYRMRGDTYGEARANILRIRVLEGLVRIPEAIAACRETIAFAERYQHAKIAVTAGLELGRLLVGAGRLDEGCEHLRSALSRAILNKDRRSRFLAHFYLWKGYTAEGDAALAEVELAAARSLVPFVDEASPEAKVVRGLFIAGGPHAS